MLAASDPFRATKKLLELKKLSEKINYKDGAMKSSMGLLLLYYNAGDYKKTIEECQVVEKYAKELQHVEYISDVYRMRGITYSSMNLLKESLAELEMSSIYADKIESSDIRAYKKALIYETYAGMYDDDPNTFKKELFYRQKSIAESKKMSEEKPVVVNAKYQNLALQYASIGLLYSNIKFKDSAIYYFHEALKIHENEKYNIYVNGKAYLLSDMAAFYVNNNDYLKAIPFAKKAENFEKQAPMPYVRKEIYHSLFDAYVETDKQDSARYYLKLHTSLSDSLQKAEKENMLSPVNQIISDNDTENKKSIQKIVFIALGVFLVLIIIGWLFWRKKSKIIKQKYEALVAKLDFENVKTDAAENVRNQDVKSIQITDETVKNLLSKLDKFEKSDKYLKREVSLTYLANNIGTNTKYLSEIIKQHKGKSFSNYINGLRIDYILRELYSNPKLREYKISHLADLSGFSSREVFAVVFKKETGITPSFFINNLK